MGRRVYQTRWEQKQIYDCFWLVTRARFKCEGQHGKAWGKLHWKGKPTSLSINPVGDIVLVSI